MSNNQRRPSPLTPMLAAIEDIKELKRLDEEWEFKRFQLTQVFSLIFSFDDNEPEREQLQ